jgi:hypothetical protein
MADDERERPKVGESILGCGHLVFGGSEQSVHWYYTSVGRTPVVVFAPDGHELSVRFLLLCRGCHLLCISGEADPRACIRGDRVWTADDDQCHQFVEPS